MTPTQFWFDSVYRSYHAYIRKAAFLIGVTHGVRSIEQWADDMTHNAFCSLLKSVMVHGIPEEDNIPGLLKGYLRNVVGNYFQKSANHESTFTEIGDAINNFPASSPIESISYPTGLSGDDRVLLHLHYSMGYTIAEIAKYYGISEDACRQRLHRARKHFKEFHEKENPSTNFDGKFTGKSVSLGTGGARHV